MWDMLERLNQQIIKDIDAQVMREFWKAIGGDMKFVLESDKPHTEVKLTLSRFSGRVFLNARIEGTVIPILSISENGDILPCYLTTKVQSNILREAGFPIDSSMGMEFVKLGSRPDPNTCPGHD